MGLIEIAETGATPEKRNAVTQIRVPFVDLKAQYSHLSEEIGKEVNGVMERCDFVLGERVRDFEREFAAYCRVAHAVGVSSGTEALHLALRALGIKEGDEVITQANTFVATLLAISYTGARPVLVDIDPETYGIDPDKVREAITHRTKAIIPVHIYGRPAPMDELKKIASAHGLYIVEDACQAHGAFCYGSKGAQRAGGLGDIAAFSFYPGKNLGAYGDGGAITTSNAELFDKVRMLRDYGQQVKYHHQFKGYNSRLDTIQAAILHVKLKYLDRWNGARAEHAKRYIELLDGIPEIKLPVFEPEKHMSHIFHLFVIRAEERTGLMEYLSARSISTGIHYPVPNHLQEAFSDLGYREGDFPVTERYAEEILSLPMFPELRYDQIKYVAGTIRDFYGR